MFIYNISLKVDWEIQKEWLLWQKEVHIPAILKTGLFYDYRFFELLDQYESDGKTFVLQFFIRKRENYEKYIHQFSSGFQQEALKKWGNQFIGFRTLLKSLL